MCMKIKCSSIKILQDEIYVHVYSINNKLEKIMFELFQNCIFLAFFSNHYSGFYFTCIVIY